MQEDTAHACWEVIGSKGADFPDTWTALFWIAAGGLGGRHGPSLRLKKTLGTYSLIQVFLFLSVNFIAGQRLNLHTYSSTFKMSIELVAFL